MLHARKDYQRIQDPEGRIGESEPVFLLRAKDELAPIVTLMWANILESRGGDPVMVAMVKEHSQLMKAWQEKHGCKLPDLPEDRKPCKTLKKKKNFRRNNYTYSVPSEVAIHNAIAEIEKMLPDTKLTRAVQYLIDASALVSDVVDEVNKGFQNGNIKPQTF